MPRRSLTTGPFRIRVQGPAALMQRLAFFYGDRLQGSEDGVHDFHIRMARVPGLRRLLAPQIQFHTDIETPFQPFPLDHAYPFFEWGLNWCIAMQAHEYLLWHMAVLARGEDALLLPGNPGSGKSTLAAALMHRGWRLLSDEFGLYLPENGCLCALPRPIPLKNAAIPALRKAVPEAVLGPLYPRTRKGDVAHVRPTAESFARAGEPARPRWILFPHYHPAGGHRPRPFPKGRCFLGLAGNAFNYGLQGARGFEAVASVVERVPAWELDYADLDAAVAAVEDLTTRPTS